MKNRKKPSRPSFGKSFENAYLSVEDRKGLKEKLVQSEKLAGIGTLASGIVNEINNPLAGIMGYAEIMFGEDDLNRMKKYAEKIVSEAERASEIIKWFSRYSREAKDSKISDVDLNGVIEESLEAVKHNWKSCDIEVVKDYKQIPTILGNRSELQQVFVNLVDNAVEAMQDGGKLSIFTTVNNGFVSVEVYDNGTGIPNKNLKRIFEPFFTTKALGKGTGLGLFVVSMIVKKHNGKIDVKSEEGKGTTVTIRFPISEGKT